MERGNPYDWLEQAQRDADGKVPVAIHKRNRKPLMVVMDAEDWIRLIKALDERR